MQQICHNAGIHLCIYGMNNQSLLFKGFWVMKYQFVMKEVARNLIEIQKLLKLLRDLAMLTKRQSLTFRECYFKGFPYVACQTIWKKYVMYYLF